MPFPQRNTKFVLILEKTSAIVYAFYHCSPPDGSLVTASFLSLSLTFSTPAVHVLACCTVDQPRRLCGREHAHAGMTSGFSFLRRARRRRAGAARTGGGAVLRSRRQVQDGRDGGVRAAAPLPGRRCVRVAGRHLQQGDWHERLTTDTDPINPCRTLTSWNLEKFKLRCFNELARFLLRQQRNRESLSAQLLIFVYQSEG